MNLRVHCDHLWTLDTPPFLGGFRLRGANRSRALVIGPTGVGLSQDGFSLEVADSLNNRLVAIRFPHSCQPDCTYWDSQSQKMGAWNDPLGLTAAANGNILTVNGGDGSMGPDDAGWAAGLQNLVDSSGNPPSQARCQRGLYIRTSDDWSGCLFR